MIYLLFVLIALVSVFAAEVYAARKGAVEFWEGCRLYKSCGDGTVVPFKGKTLIAITIICCAASSALQVSLYKNTTVLSFVKLYGVSVIVMCAGMIDLKRRIIPNFLILLGAVFRAGIYVYEVFFTEDIKAVFINDLIGFAIGFVFLSLVCIITKGALGFGDAKLFGIIGITTGAVCTYSTLFVSLVLSVAVALIGMAAKKMKRKDSFPFGPCIAAGYAIAVMLTAY